MLGVLHCCGSIRSRLGRGSVHSCNSVPKCTRINLRTSEIAKISWVGGACPQTPLVNANFARILHMPWLDHLNLACSDISGAREFTSCPSESLPTVKQQLNSWESYTTWLVIFARYLSSRFSRVKSHSRKLKPWKFWCPCVKRMNCVSILAYFYIAAYKSMSASVHLTAITEVIQNATSTQTHNPDSGTRPRAEAIATGPRFTDCEN